MKYITCLLVGTLLSAYTTAEAADTKIVVNPVQPTQRTLFPLTDVRLGDSQFKDIQELDHEDFPRRHRNVVDSVLFGVGRSRAFRIDAEDAGNEFPVDEVAGYERGQCDGESNHRLTTITRMARCRAVR